MFLKLGIKVLFVIIEIFLGFYSLVVSESLLIKFVFFLVSAGIIAFGMVKSLNKILPADNEAPLIPSDLEEQEA